MPEVFVVGAFTARDGKESDAQQAFEALVDPTHAEDGCILDTTVDDALPGGEEKKGSLAAHAGG